MVLQISLIHPTELNILAQPLLYDLSYLNSDYQGNDPEHANTCKTQVTANQQTNWCC